MNTNENLILKFDPNTIQHLGVSLYTKLPTVISELISNSWDADAKKIQIHFKDKQEPKEVIYKDDGDGMNFNELNDKYLVIGRNRRAAEKSDLTKLGRKVIGKKGLGKLAVFGICDEIEVLSIKDGLKNHFRMNFEKIKSSSNNEYTPEIIAKNEKVSTKEHGTMIHLKKVRRKTNFDPKEIAVGLSKKFLIFDQLETSIRHNEEESIMLTNELKFQGLRFQFEWELPDEKYGTSYAQWKDIRGKIFTLETPLKDTDMRGVYLTSRGKIVNTAEFYGLRDNDQFHSYVTGYLEVDFIDDFKDDVISTDRQSLNWEHDQSRELQDFIQSLIKQIGQEWRKKRAQLKTDSILRENGFDIREWQGKLPTYEKLLSEKIIDPILENSNIDINESKILIEGVIDKFNNKTFKDYASKIADISKPEDIPALLNLMNEWKIVETRQISDLAYSRVEVIKQFEKYIETNTKEVPTLHNFLKKFSWLLDPRILEFRDEVTYSTLLKETYPDEKLDETDRRIDFLCSSALGNILYVIEIKRSKYKVDVKALEQAYEYGAFLKEKFASESGFSKVVCYVVGGEKSGQSLFANKEKTYANSGEVFVKTYRELLEQSREYHREFIEAYKPK